MAQHDTVKNRRRYSRAMEAARVAAGMACTTAWGAVPPAAQAAMAEPQPRKTAPAAQFRARKGIMQQLSVGTRPLRVQERHTGKDAWAKNMDHTEAVGHGGSAMVRVSNKGAGARTEIDAKSGE